MPLIEAATELVSMPRGLHTSTWPAEYFIHIVAALAQARFAVVPGGFRRWFPPVGSSRGPLQSEVRLRSFDMVIPISVLESLSGTPTSEQMRDAAAELAFRIAHGEYDDLDEIHRVDLQALAEILEMWSRRVAELEAAMHPRAGGGLDLHSKP